MPGSKKPVSVQPQRSWALIVATAAFVLGMAAVLFYAAMNQGSGRAPLVKIPGTEEYSDLARNHVEGRVTYAQNPPVGGDHSGVWQSCGVYEGEVAPERGVHSLEHGAVWVTYRKGLSVQERTAVESLARGQSHVLVSPVADLPSPVVASAWGLQLRLDSPSDPRLAKFVRQYAEGPQTPEKGVPCVEGGTKETGPVPAASASASPGS